MIEDKRDSMNQPSSEALRNMLKFLMKTSIPRLLAKREKEVKTIEDKNDSN